MTQPGSVQSPSPGWWVRTDLVGVADTECEWATHSVGESPIFRFYRRPMIPNPNVGPMALRKNFRRKPQSQTRRISPVFDATANGTQAVVANNGTSSWTHTAGSTANAVIVVMSGFCTNNTVTTTATYGGVAMTQLAAVTNYGFDGTAYESLWVFGLLNPATGAQTAAVTFNSSSASYQTTPTSFSYSGVGGFGTVATGTGVSSSPSFAVPSISGELVFHTFAGYIYNFSAYTQTQRANRNYSASNGLAVIAGDGPGAYPSVTFGATIASGATAIGSVGVPLQPAK